MSIVGLVLRMAYQLRRHFWLAWPISRWLGLALLVLAIWAAASWWPNLWPAAAILLAWLAYVALLALAAHSRYLYYRVLRGAAARLQNEDPAPPLAKLEMVPARASGWFSVERQSQHFVDLDADLETTGSREHIVLARVHPSRILFVGRWPGHELGWWYIFFQPPAIRRLSLGHLHFGLRPRMALRVEYTLKSEKKERVESVFLTFPDDGILRRVWEDLVRDAPSGATIQ